MKAKQAAILLALPAAVGCGRTAEPSLKFPGDPVALKIKDRTIIAAVACDPLSRNVGLMHRKSLDQDQGMLFIFKELKRLSFWMKNTHIPLSIAFISGRGTILEIKDMKPLDETSIESEVPVLHALEMNQGWFALNGIKVGDTFADFGKTVGGFDVR